MDATRTNQFPTLAYWLFALLVLFALLILLLSSNQSVSKDQLAQPTPAKTTELKPPHYPAQDFDGRKAVEPQYVRKPGQLEIYKPANQ